MIGPRKNEEERRGGALPFWLAGRGERLLLWFLRAPDAWLARVGVGAALALNLAWLAALVANPASPAPAGGSAGTPFPQRGAFEARDALLSPGSMLGGLRAILAPDFMARQVSPEARSAEGSSSAQSPMLELNGAAALKEKDARGKGKEGEGKEGAKGRETGGGEDIAGASPQGTGGSSAASTAGRAIFGLSQAPGSSAGPGARSAPGSAAEGADATARSLTPMNPGRKAVTRLPARGRSAMDQLKFAQNQSAAARMSSSPERSYQTADSAFQGQTAVPGGIPAVAGGPTTAAPQPSPVSEPSPRAVSPPLSCPSGYALSGTMCQPLQAQNVAPYQGLVDTARKMLIAAAILAALGLFLLLGKGGAPGMQILGGLLLGAAVALALAAMVIGNTIQSEYGQTPQKKAIDAGAGRALQGG